MELHESIRKARQQAGVSGAKIAELLGMSAQAYRRYERGEVVPNATTILELAGILQCSPTALMQTGGVEEQRPTNLRQKQRYNPPNLTVPNVGWRHQLIKK